MSNNSTSLIHRIASWLHNILLPHGKETYTPHTTQLRIKERDQEINELMAVKLEQEALALLADRQKREDPATQLKAYFLLNRAKEVRQGETSLLSAMGLINSEAN